MTEPRDELLTPRQHVLPPSIIVPDHLIVPQRNASPTSSFDRPLQNHAMPTPVKALVWADGDLAAENKDKRESNAMMMSANGIAEAKATMWSLERPRRRVMGCDWRSCVRWGVWRCGDVWRCGGEEARPVLSLVVWSFGPQGGIRMKPLRQR
jgi:hypothetical protein